MSSNTPRFGFLVLDSDRDTLAEANFQFGLRDRELLDSILAYITEHHRHDGRSTPTTTRPAPPLLELQASSGHIPPAAKVSYRYAFVDDRGQELAASGSATVTTSFQISAPTRLTVSTQTGVGSLPAGTYAYALSAYTGSVSNETPVGSSTSTTLSATGQILIGGPPNVESSESGYNVYRRGPGDADYYFLGSLLIDETYTDDGLTASDPYHRRPTGNTTYLTNRVLVTRTASLPDGYTWKLYRTYDDANWDNTLIYAGTASAFYDLGAQSSTGGPQGFNTGSGSPPKITLTDAEHVIGGLPPGLIVFPVEHVFRFDDAGAAEGQWPWFSPYEHAQVTSMRAWLDRGAIADDEVKAQLWALPANARNFGVGVVPWAAKTSSVNAPVIAAGETRGEPVTYDPALTIAKGEGLRVDVIDGATTTPGAAGLYVAVTLVVASADPSDQTTTHVWGT